MATTTNTDEVFPQYRFDYDYKTHDLCIEAIGRWGSHIVEPQDGDEYWKKEMERKVLFDLAYPFWDWGMVYQREGHFWQSNNEKCLKAQDEYLAIKKEKKENVWKKALEEATQVSALSASPPRRKKKKNIKLIKEGGE